MKQHSSQQFLNCSWASVFAEPFEKRTAQKSKDFDINRIDLSLFKLFSIR